ncbi:MAG TPA: gas vesicle protein [Mycobacteriales bacterium]|nr:gas vesicle protein [Mycobacteriales bacterium]
MTYPAQQPVRTLSPRASRSGESLADILERVLDKGVVIAGDVVVNVLDIELLTLKVRLIIASADTAQAMGIDWWTSDPFLSRNAAELQRENDDLRERIERLERALPAARSDGEQQ